MCYVALCIIFARLVSLDYFDLLCAVGLVSFIVTGVPLLSSAENYRMVQKDGRENMDSLVH